VLTQPRGVPLAFLAVLAIGLAARRRVPRRLLVPGLAAAGLVLAAIVVAVVAGGVLDSTAGAHFDVRQFASYVWQFYLPRLPFMSPPIGPDYGARAAYIETFYGVFASLEVRWPAAVYDVLELLTLAGLGALATVLIRARARLRAQWPVVVLLAAMPLTLVAALHYAAYRALQVDPTDPIVVGRYLFPLLPLFGLAVALVVGALPRRASVATGTALLLGGALLGLSGLGMTAVRFYV
jgi:hypothetical protein